MTLPHLFDEPLAEGWGDPLPGVDATVHEDGGLGEAGLLAELEDGHGATLVGVSNHLLADQPRVGGGHGGDPGLDLKGEIGSKKQPWRVGSPTVVPPSYLIPRVVLGVAVSSGGRLKVSLTIDGSLHILNKDPETQLWVNNDPRA